MEAGGLPPGGLPQAKVSLNPRPNGSIFREGEGEERHIYLVRERDFANGNYYIRLYVSPRLRKSCCECPRNGLLHTLYNILLRMSHGIT